MTHTERDLALDLTIALQLIRDGGRCTRPDLDRLIDRLASPETSRWAAPLEPPRHDCGNDPDCIMGPDGHCHHNRHEHFAWRAEGGTALPPLDVDEQAAILDDVIPAADFGEVARTEVMYSIVRALHENGYGLGAASERPEAPEPE